MPPGANIANTPLVVTHTQNTAPVLEFNCLYTHDIRRKAKRWQDGFLRFHTFNKRVMVYDVPRNLIGDTHWRDSDLLQDGDEVKLDKNGVLVQVADQIGQTETDLTGIRKSKNQTTANPASSSPLRLSSAITIVNPTLQERRPLQAKHRSLNAMLGPSRNPIGKAVLPAVSPFETRRQELRDQENEWAQQGNAKRRRVTMEPSPAVREVGTTMRAPDTQRARAQTSNVSTKAKVKTPDTRIKAKAQSNSIARRREAVEIDLCSDKEDSMLSSMLLENTFSSPKRAAARPARPPTPPRRVSDHEATGKRLSLAKSAPKRITLACHSMVSMDSDTRIQEEQKRRVGARLARLKERESARVQQTRQVTSPPIVARQSPIVVLSSSPPQVASRTEAATAPLDLHEFSEDLTLSPKPALESVHDEDVNPLVMSDHVDTATSNFDLAKDEIAAFENEPVFEDDTVGPERLVEESAEVFRPSKPTHIPGTPVESRSPPKIPQNELEQQQMVQASDEAGTLDQEASAAPVTGPQDASGPSIVLEPDRPVTETVPAKLSDLAAQQPFAPRKRNKVGRLDIRKSAVSCFKPPTAVPRTSLVHSTRSANAHTQQSSITMSSTRTSGPWSREAFDLFSWRPPGWDEASWSLKS